MNVSRQDCRQWRCTTPRLMSGCLWLPWTPGAAVLGWGWSTVSILRSCVLINVHENRHATIKGFDFTIFHLLAVVVVYLNCAAVLAHAECLCSDFTVCVCVCDACTGKLYAVGGYDGASRQCLSTVEEYNPVSDKWCYVADMSTRRSGAG